MAALRTFLASARTLVVLAGLILTLRPGVARGAATAEVTGLNPGFTPFVNWVNLQVQGGILQEVRFRVAPKPGSFSRSIRARYSAAYLLERGYYNPQTGALRFPVFGLYAGYANRVTLTTGFRDGSHVRSTLVATTQPYDDPIFSHPTILKARTDAQLSFDFFMIKSDLSTNSPFIVDTDGEIRWVGSIPSPSFDYIFYDNSIFTSDGAGLLRLELDGTSHLVADYSSIGVTGMHHNFDLGKNGILLDVSTTDYYASTILEVNPSTGAVLQNYNLAAIMTAAMVAGGDDPSTFIPAAGVLSDWFHNNCATYRPSDDSVLISSRENFVICLDYSTGAIKWIFGDPTKQWYQFPSLRKYALTPVGNTPYPIGQHSLSIVNDHLLLFDDGEPSFNHQPAGASRTYSAPRKYRIDDAAGTATEIWHYARHEKLYSPIASSIYQDEPGNYLIDYATIGPFLFADIVGLDPAGSLVFDYQYKEEFTAGSAWNTVPIAWHDLHFD